MEKNLLKVQLEIFQIPRNLFGPSALFGQLFGIFLKKSPHDMSIVHAFSLMAGISQVKVAKSKLVK